MGLSILFMIFVIGVMITGGMALGFSQKNRRIATKWMHIMVAVGVLAVLSGGTMMGENAHREKLAEEMRIEYRELKLYSGTVEFSENEYLRFRYYNEVNDYNARYDEMVRLQTNWFTGNIGPDDMLEGYGRIDFTLRGDDYLG